MIYRMKPTSDQQELLRIDFNYAVAVLSVDVVENIIALRPLAVNQPGKTSLTNYVVLQYRKYFTVS